MTIKLIDNEKKLDFSDVLIVPKTTYAQSRKDVELECQIVCPHSKRELTGIPIISANMDRVSTVSAANVLGDHNCFTALHKFITFEELKCIKHKDKTFLTFGITENFDDIKYKLLAAGVESGKELFCLDVANGGMLCFIEFVRKVRNAYPTSFIIAGNCVTEEVAKLILNAGASMVKVGIGSGAHCKTRTVTGVGYPQMAAVSDIVDSIEDINIVSDGGSKTVSDIAKAFVVGAKMVMVGTMFAGHYENSLPSEARNFKNEHYEYNYLPAIPDETILVPMRGMSSHAVMGTHYNSDTSYKTSEGHETMIPYKGEIERTIKDILGGLRSTCTYTDCRTLYRLHGQEMVLI